MYYYLWENRMVSNVTDLGLDVARSNRETKIPDPFFQTWNVLPRDESDKANFVYWNLVALSFDEKNTTNNIILKQTLL